MATTLQINVAPPDLPHLIHTLPHQCRQLGSQVDEILLTVDLHQSCGPYGTAWRERLPGFLRFLDEQCGTNPKMRVHEADYSPEAMVRVGEQFFGCAIMPPAKDWNGAPFYSYLSGFAHARYDSIFHIDSDMMFGGGSSTWIAEATQLIKARPEIFVCSPLPGPPTQDGSLRSQNLVREPYTSPAFRASAVSTRVAFFDRQCLMTRLWPLSLLPAPVLRSWQARLEGNFPCLLLEQILSFAMQQRGLFRVDFLGQDPGLWSLHPPYRSPLFYERLPSLINSIERGEVPEAQRGDYDLNDSMIDWSTVRNSGWRRKLKRLHGFYQHVSESRA